MPQPWLSWQVLILVSALILTFDKASTESIIRSELYRVGACLTTNLAALYKFGPNIHLKLRLSHAIHSIGFYSGQDAVPQPLIGAPRGIEC